MPTRRLVAERLEDRNLLAVLFEHGASDPVQVLVPLEAHYDDLGFDWTGLAEPFDDSSWTTVTGTPNGVGYDRGSGAYDSVIGLDVESTMYEDSTTLFARAEFEVVDATAVGKLTLRLRYDDGFIAWLNGAEVARANVVSSYPAWDARATSEYEAPSTPVEFDLSAHVAQLRSGANVLAIRLLNDSPTGDDALLQFTLSGESREGPPLAIDDAAETQEGQAVTIDVLANDREGSAPINQSSVAIAVPPAHGTATVNANGTITYTPSGIYNGPDTFSYTVRDSNAGQPTSPTLVSSTSLVKAFIPQSDSLGTTWRGQIANFNDSAWLTGTYGVGYDTFPQYLPYIGLNVQAMHNATTSVYTRSTFMVDDPGEVTALQLLMRYDDGFVINGVQIAGENAPSTLNNTSAALQDRLDDHEFRPFDASSFISALKPGLNVLAIHGLNTLVSSSDLILQPQLIATITPSGELSNVATVTVNVAAVDYPPIARDDIYQVDEGTTLVVNNAGGSGLLANDSEPDNQSLTAVLLDGPANGTLDFGSDGTFEYLPNAGFIGVDTFTYRASDGVTFSQPATVSISVRHVPPAAAPDSYETDEDSPLLVPTDAGVLANDSDTQHHPLRAYVVTTPSQGVVSLELDGSFAYTPRANYHGSDSFTYQVTDGQFNSEPTVVSITVTAVNDAPVASSDIIAVAPGEPTVLPWLSERYATAIASSGPTSHWRLGDSSGSTAIDSAGTLDGKYYGSPQFGIAGAIGSDADTAVFFDGVEDYIEHGHAANVNPAGSFSIEAWARPANLRTNYQTLVMSRDVLPGLMLTGYNIYISPSNRWEFWTGSGQRLGQDWDYMNGPSVKPGEWIYLVATFQTQSVGADGVHVGTKQLYVNGHLFASKNNALYAPNTTADFRIGSALAPNRASAPFNGAIDEFAMYDHALSASEVTAHYAIARRGLSVQEPLIASRSSWQYRDNVANGASYPVDAQLRSWTDRQYNATAWSTGPAILGYGGIEAGPTNTTIGFGGNPDDKYRTALFRRTFSILDRDAITGLSLEMLADDAAVVYVNGTELLRYNLPGTVGDGAITTNTLAPVAGDETAYHSYSVDLASFPNLLISGQNVIAVEVHQVTVNSSDLGFDLALFAVTRPTTFVPGLLDNDVDADSDALSLEVASQPQHGMLTVDNGSTTFTPDPGYEGVDAFSYRAFDGQVFSPLAVVTLVVSPPGKSPQDLNADGTINAGDVAFLLASFGKASGAKAIEGDLDADARISVRDAIQLRNAFTPTSSPSAAAAIVARVSDRALVEAASVNLLRADRRVRRFGDILSETKPAATGQALAAIVETPSSLTGRRSRLLQRTRG